MAKWGEGDPRWIVEERPDATNVNNWHWTEKNACAWSIAKFKELLTDLAMDGNVGRCVVTEVEKTEGEAVVNNRKGKLIFFYEWDITLKWKGKVKGGEDDIEGTIEIPNLSEENGISEIDFNIHVKDGGDDGSLLKEFIHREGKEVIRKQLDQYVILLKQEFSKGMILPKKDGVDDVKTTCAVSNLSAGFNKQVHVNSHASDTNFKTDTTTIKLTVSFQCKAEEFYNAMMKLEMVQAFTHGPVKLEPQVGGKFEFFGGNIYGEFLELIPNKKIVQRWRSKRWPHEHFSKVSFFIEEKSDHTEVRLLQTDVPVSEADITRENWDRYYWEAMKRSFGFGSFFV